MKHKRFTPSLLPALLLAAGFAAQAQNQMVLSLTSGQTETISVSEIRSIKFAGDSMKVTRNDGTQSSWAVAAISQYAFSDATSANEMLDSGDEQAVVFPNPATGQFSISYQTKNSSRISIELLDLNGRVLRSIFQGMHEGHKTYSRPCDLPAGMYVCRITSEQKVITQSFVIQ